MRKLVSVAALAVLIAAGCNNASTNSSSKAPASGNGGSPKPAPSVQLAPGALAITPENTKIEWVGTKPEGKHNGGFKQFSGGVENVAPGLAGSKITVTIDTDSLYSDTEKLTGHLKSPDFFEVRTHPQATFASTSIEPAKGGEATHTITGDLMLHGVTKKISFPAKITQENGGLKLESKFTINRTDFDMKYGQGKVDNDVTISVAVNIPGR